MKRREFLTGVGAAGLAGSAVGGSGPGSARLHLVSLSFDDGFRRSFLRTAEIYERFSLSACFNLVASAHLPGNLVRDKWMPQTAFGDFGIWNELQDRGHEIMIHGYQHALLTRLSLKEAKDLVLRSLDLFSKELRGFDPARAVFNFPYNASTPELEEWLPSVVMAYRTRGEPINPIPGPQTCRITTESEGPGNAETHVDARVEELLAGPEGWMVYNLHGLDEEGWGPVRPAYLERLLDRLRKIESVRILPTGRALMQARAGVFSRRPAVSEK